MGGGILQYVDFSSYHTIDTYVKTIKQNQANDKQIIILPIMRNNDEKKIESNPNNNNEK